MDMVNVSQEQHAEQPQTETRPDNLNINHCHYCKNIAPISKTCTNCHELKNITEFYKINNKNQRYRAQCKKCENKKRVQKFKNKGFTVFSVSLDEDVNSWKAAIQKDQLSWPTHVSDLKGWKSPLVSTFGFDGIPFTILLNKEGNIIGKNLRGEKLEEKLNELLK